jgi:hypothetical protein
VGYLAKRLAAVSRAGREGDGYKLCWSPDPELLDGTRGSKAAVSAALVGVQCPCGLARFEEVIAVLAAHTCVLTAQAFRARGLVTILLRLYMGSGLLW